MATNTLSDFAVTSTWQNLVSALPAAASVDVLIQVVKTSDRISVVWGGASAPVGKTGNELNRGDSVQGNAANIWLRSEDQSGTVSVTTL